MIRAILLLSMTMLLSCSEDGGLPPGLRAGGFEMRSYEHGKLIHERMEIEEIAFIVDEKGTTRYMQSDVAEVRKIRRAITSDGEINPNNIESEVAINEVSLNLYKEALESESVPYTIENKGEYYLVFWRVQYAAIVDQIVEDIGFKLHEHYKNN